MERLEPIDMTEVLRGAPAGEWLALSNDESKLLAWDPSLAEAIRKANQLGEDDPVVMKLPPAGLLVL